MAEPGVPTRDELELHAQWNERMALRYDPDAFITRSGPLVRWIEALRLERTRKALACGPGHDVLDLGCGPGNLLERLSGRRVVGVDLSETLLGQARTRLGSRPGFELRRAAAEELPFPDASFDRIVCSEVLEHVISPGSVIAEIRRVARPGARVVLTLPNEGLINATKKVVIALGIKSWIAGRYPMSDQMLEEWHRNELGPSEILGLCRKGFHAAGAWDIPFPALAYHRVLAFDVKRKP